MRGMREVRTRDGLGPPRERSIAMEGALCGCVASRIPVCHRARGETRVETLQVTPDLCQMSSLKCLRHRTL